MKVILEDTRNQLGKHKLLNQYLENHGYKVVRQAMYVGDYMAADNAKVAVDTKKDVLELIQDMHQDHERFRRECERAHEAGIALVILIEEALPGGRLENWQSPRYLGTNKYHRSGDPVTRTNMTVLKRALVTMQDKYGVAFRFCPKRESGKWLLHYLGLP